MQLGHVLFMGIFYNDGSVPIEKYRAIIVFHDYHDFPLKN